jgi:hypothetical protein
MEPIDIDTFEDEVRGLGLPRDRKDATQAQMDRYAELGRAVTAYYAAEFGKGFGPEGPPEWAEGLAAGARPGERGGAAWPGGR